MSTIYTSAEDAEEAFYDALGRGDLDALMSIWAEDEDIVCIHPTGQRLTGAAAIRESWRGILEANPRFSVHVQRKLCWESLMISVHSVIETLYLEKDQTVHGPMVSTNVYLRGASGWRLLSRHASVADDESGNEAEDSQSHTLH